MQTRFATTTLAHAALAPRRGPHRRSRGRRRPCSTLPTTRSARRSTADQLTFVGRGWTNGIAQEAGLKLRESAQLWTEAYPMMEYRHGPISISAPGRVVWAFGELVDDFADDVAVTGAELPARSRSTRWPTCCGCTGCAWSGRARRGSTPTSRAT